VFSRDLLDLVARRLQAIGEPTRMRIVTMLQGREATVQELTDRLSVGAGPLTQQNVSKHLGILYQAGVLARQRDERSSLTYGHLRTSFACGEPGPPHDRRALTRGEDEINRTTRSYANRPRPPALAQSRAGALTFVGLRATLAFALALPAFALASSPARADIAQFLLPGTQPDTSLTAPYDHNMAASSSGIWWWSGRGSLSYLSPQGAASTVANTRDGDPFWEGLRGEEVAAEPGGSAIVGPYNGGLLRLSASGAREALRLPPKLKSELEAEQGLGSASGIEGAITGSLNGTVWFTFREGGEGSCGRAAPAVGSFTPDGTFTKVVLKGVELNAGGYTALDDGSLWISTNPGCSNAPRGFLHVSGPEAYAMFPYEFPLGALAAGPHGEAWFASQNHLTSMALGGAVTQYTLPSWVDDTIKIAVGHEGTVWMLTKLYPEHQDTACKCEIVLTRFAAPNSITVYSLGKEIPNATGSAQEENIRELAGLSVGPEGDAWVGALVYTSGLFQEQAREFLRVTPSTPGSAEPQFAVTTVPSRRSVVHPIDIAAEQRALNRLKAAARAIDTAGTAIDVLKYTIAGAALVGGAPELTVALMEPSLAETAAETVGELSDQLVIEDPPDPHFTRPTHMTRPSLRAVKPGRGVSRSSAGAWNALISDQLGYAGAVNALVESVQRAEGAAEAGNCTWLKRQNSAAKAYAQLAEKALSRTAKLYSALRRALRRSRLRGVRISQAQFVVAQQQVAMHGLPAPAVRALNRLGVSESEQRALAAAVAALRPRPIDLLATLTEAAPKRSEMTFALAGLARAAARAPRCRHVAHKHH
jgi:DNA-binding transcriptional ArsR family regulator